MGWRHKREAGRRSRALSQRRRGSLRANPASAALCAAGPAATFAVSSSSMRKFIFIVAGLFSALQPIHAGQQISDGKNSAAVAESPFVKGGNELELSAGAFGSLETSGDPTRPNTGFALGSLRFGRMLTSPSGSGCLRGNWEILAGVFGGGIFEGPGNALGGADVLLRYNFVQPGARVVPFFQIGGGGVFSDAAHDDQIQHLIGSDWSFVLEGEAGARFLLSSHWAITVGAQFYHISNADIAVRNRGLNALGGVLGVDYFF
jgi:lipid A 3-O-deacylase